MKVHLDTDIGGDIDDLCALAMLLGWSGVDLVGVTTAAEHGGRRCGYARHALALARRGDVPVAAGIDVSSGCFRSMPGYPAEDDYWGGPVPPQPGDPKLALDLLSASIADGAVIVAIGPYTNLAALEVREAGILSRAHLVLMGTTVVPSRPGFPDWGPETDYNVQMDVSAAELVLARSDALLVPIGPCLETVVRRSDVGALSAGGPLAQLIARQISAFDRDWENAHRWANAYAGLPEDMVNFLYDPLACAAGVGWHGVRTEALRAGWARSDDGLLQQSHEPGGKLYRVVTGVDGPAFHAAWLNAILRVR